VSNAVVKTITDVATMRTADFHDLPAGWATPAGGGLHLVATAEVDRLGRVTKRVDPAGNVTWTVYDDVGHATRTYAGWNAVAGTTTGPITVTRDDPTGTYREELTYAAPVAAADGRPTGAEAIENMQSLTRWSTNAAGQVIAVDRYFDLDRLAWSTAATLGTEGVNFLRTRYAYNNQGAVSRVQSPAGTIMRSVYDGLSRLVGTWVGTDDTTTNGYTWTPANATGTSNLVQVAAYEYDDGGTGDGNLTRVTALPGTTDVVVSAARVTQHAYDWRDRRVATKTGAEATLASESGGVNRPLVWTSYDNLDRPVTAGLYDGDGVPATLAAPATTLLRGLQTTAYDARGRVFLTQVFAVDQSTGLHGPAVETKRYYDRRGDVVLVTVPNGPPTLSRYDGAGRLVATYTLGRMPVATWNAATSLSAAVVLEQHEFVHDAAGNTILETLRQRFHDASPTATGPLGTPTSGIRARVSFVASYDDTANRLAAVVDVGTNGGAAFARPDSVPGRSVTALVTSFGYDAAGRLRDITDPGGIVSRTIRDPLDRTTATIANFTGGAAGSQTDVTTLLRYDAAGRLASRTAVQPGTTPSQTTGYLYGVSTAAGSGLNSNDILAAVVHPDPLTGLPASSDRDTFTVNALGEPATGRDRNGTVHAYGYDVAGRPTSDSIVVVGAGVDGTILRIETSYDTAGHATTLTSYDAASGGAAAVRNQVQRQYNAFGQVVREAQSHVGAVTPDTPAVRYGFSGGAAGNHSRLTAVTYPDGRTLSTVYDAGLDAAASRPSRILGQAAGAGQAVVLEAFRYLGAGTVVERSHPEVNLTLTAINPTGAAAAAGDKYTGLDRFGRVADQRWVRVSGATTTDVDRVLTTYDRTGNPTRRITPLAAAFSEASTYDGLGQLTSMTRAGGAGIAGQSWQFDALGNWQVVATNGTRQSRTTNARNEITAVGGRPLAYDAAGNLLVDAAGRRFTYDAWNRLVKVADARGGVIARYEYDPLGQRIVQRTATAATAEVRDFYFSTQWQVLEERVRTAAGLIPAAANTQYVWSPVSSDALIERDRNSDARATTGVRGLEQRIYVVQDANWNTTALVAAAGVPGVAAGAVINRFAYTAYGEVQVLSASWVRAASVVSWQYLHQGLRFEAATGLASARNRDYSPSLGRFLERDPLGFKAGDDNVYRFVGNAPFARTDPSGLCELIGAEPTLTVSGVNPLRRTYDPLDERGREAAKFADKVYNRAYDDGSPTRGGLLGQFGISYEPTAGFQAALFRGDNGTFYLAFRGTEQWSDWGANLNQGRGIPTDQYRQAIELAKRVKREIVEKLGATLILTGHSLGGGLGAAASHATGLDAELFNPAWINSPYNGGLSGRIRSHVIIGDPLDGLRKRIGADASGELIYHDRKSGCGSSHTMGHFLD
jgi:RHS repeat-associated protein